MKSAIVIGCFDFLGFAITELLLEGEYLVYGLPSKKKNVFATLKEMEVLRHASFHAIANQALENNETPEKVDVLFYCEEDGDSEQLKQALSVCKKKQALFIFHSSLDVYEGARGENVITEETPIKPESEFARNLQQAEEKIQRICKEEGISYIVIRTSPLYGPWQPSCFSFQAIIEGEASDKIEPPSNPDVVYVRDAAVASVKASQKKSLYGETLHISSGKEDQWKKGVSLLIEQDFLEPQEEKLRFSIAKAKREIKFSPDMDLEKGLEQQKEFHEYKQKLDKLNLLDF